MENPLQYEIVRIFKDIFNTLNIKGYLVGGAVRDMVLGTHPLDFDFTVELNEMEHFKKSEEIARILGCTCRYNQHYHTAKYNYEGNDIDFVMARGERYPQIASKPVVYSSEIFTDITRRDFTVNSIAMKMGENFGELLDPTRGVYDIEKGIIRVIHNESFRDDPTRLFRGIKYASRFNFQIEHGTYELMRKCLCNGYLKYLRPQRITQEIFRIFEDFNIKNSLSLIKNLSVFNYITDKNVNINLCYNESKFKLLPNKKKMVVMFCENEMDCLINLKDSLDLGYDFINDILKLKQLKSKLLEDDRTLFKFLFKNQNSLDFEILKTLFSEDNKIENFIKFKVNIKIPMNEAQNLNNENKEDFIIDLKIEKLIKLIGGH